MKDANAALALRIEQDLNRKESLLAQIAEKDAMNKILSEQLGNQ